MEYIIWINDIWEGDYTMSPLEIRGGVDNF